MTTTTTTTPIYLSINKLMAKIDENKKLNKEKKLRFYYRPQ